MNTIAILGTGIMGRGIASNLRQKTSFQLRLFARKLAYIQNMADINTVVTDNPEEAVKEADFVILCLTEDPIVEKAFYDSNILDYRPKYVIDMGTTSPELTEKLYNVCKNNAIKFIDSPMTGSKNAARDGQILFMMGGDDEDFETCKPIFQACGKNTVRCGEVGSGQKVKITLNLVQAIVLQAYMEGVILSEKLGIKKEIFSDILSQSAARSGISDFKLPFIFQKNFETHFSLKNMTKDVRHALSLARKNNLNLPEAFTVENVFEEGMKLGFGEEDFCGLFRVNEKNNS